MEKTNKRKGLVVQKYGGTSVADVEKIKKIAAYAKTYFKKGIRLVIVVSAMGKATDHMIDLASEITDNPSPREFDQFLQTEEVKTAALLAIALENIGVPAKSYTATQIGLTTSKNHGSAKIKNIRHKKDVLKEAREKVLVIAGFQGLADGSNDITTLGRGGSDATAVAIAEQLNADICEIYTDVDGVYTVDPRVVVNARKFKKIGYAQMLSLAATGAGVLMDRCVEIADAHNVKIRVLLSPSLGDSDGGTLVTATGSLINIEEGDHLAGIAIRKDVGIITLNNIPNVHGSARKIFETLNSVNIIDTVQGPGEKTASISMLLDKKTMEIAIRQFSALSKIKMTSHNDLVALTLVDRNMKDMPKFFLRIGKALDQKKINIIMIASSFIGITIAIKSNELKKAAVALAEEFGLTG